MTEPHICSDIVFPDMESTSPVRNFREKKSPVSGGFHGWDREIRTPEMTGSEPVALPLGYIPMRNKYYMLYLNCCKGKFSKSETRFPYSRADKYREFFLRKRLKGNEIKLKS